ncbi:MAG: phosphatase PAP2 family protein [Chloroflexi bacterium]|nr:phosphatase PAP2 family protein [Chloroflexota bacterium]
MLFSCRNVLPCVLVTITLAAIILAWVYPVWPGDEEILLAIREWRNPFLDGVFRALSYLGWYPVATTLCLVALLALLALRRWRDGLLLALVVLSAAPAYGLKGLIGRARPDYAIMVPTPDSFGFPSGHAAFAMLLGGFLICMAWQHVGIPWLRWGIAAGLALLVLGVGTSRIYLGVHWPSDVAGGYLYGAAVLAVAFRFNDAVRNRIGRMLREDNTL